MISSVLFLIMGTALLVFNAPLAVFYYKHRPAFDDYIQILNPRQRVLILGTVFTLIGLVGVITYSASGELWSMHLPDEWVKNAILGFYREAQRRSASMGSCLCIRSYRFMIAADEKSFLIVAGSIMILLSPLIAKLFIWWEKNVIRFDNKLNPWIYRIWIILFGAMFIFIGLNKEGEHSCGK